MPKGVANLIPDTRKYDKQKRIKRMALENSYYKSSSPYPKMKKKKKKKGKSKKMGTKKRGMKLSSHFGDGNY